MEKHFKVLNLYACLGGNRLLWENCEVTAVELDAELARMYQERFPSDRVIIADAHEYLLNHYKEYDFIWSSPPCPTHSRIRHSQAQTKRFVAEYPDFKLYEEIVFLKHHFLGKWVVENVIPYYTPLIPAQTRGRHLYWTNFSLPAILSNREKTTITSNLESIDYKNLCKFHGINLDEYKGSQRKIKIARNLVDYEAGLTIFNTALEFCKPKNKSNIPYSNDKNNNFNNNHSSFAFWAAFIFKQ